MSYKKNGLLAIYESETGAENSFVLLTEGIRRDSTFPIDPITNELSSVLSQSGSDAKPVIHIEDYTKFNDMQTRALAKTKRYYAFRFPNTVMVTSEPVPVVVTPKLSASRLDGDAFWVFMLQNADDIPMKFEEFANIL